MLLKMEKHVNACVKVIWIARRTAKLSRGRATVKRRPFEAQGKQDAALQKKKNALAQGMSCGRLASIAAPLM